MNKLSLEEKKVLLAKLNKRCLIVSDFMILVRKSRGLDVSFATFTRNGLISNYERIKNDVVHINDHIMGYREAIRDDNKDILQFLSKEEQTELKKKIRDELGPDMV